MAFRRATLVIDETDRPSCSHCKNIGMQYIGHTVQNCYVLLNTMCSYCREYGHTKKYCQILQNKMMFMEMSKRQYEATHYHRKKEVSKHEPRPPLPPQSYQSYQPYQPYQQTDLVIVDTAPPPPTIPAIRTIHQTKKCGFCKKLGMNPFGHTAKECSVLANTTCNYCKTKGHTVTYCQKLKNKGNTKYVSVETKSGMEISPSTPEWKPEQHPEYSTPEFQLDSKQGYDDTYKEQYEHERNQHDVKEFEQYVKTIMELSIPSPPYIPRSVMLNTIKSNIESKSEEKDDVSLLRIKIKKPRIMIGTVPEVVVPHK